MLARIFPLLLVAWLVASLRLDAHVHWHDVDGPEIHSHVVTGFDVDHALAHAQGAVQENPDAVASRVSSQLVLLACSATFLLPLIGRIVRQPLWRAAARVTGPPSHIRPPSQAPPLRDVFA